MSGSGNYRVNLSKSIRDADTQDLDDSLLSRLSNDEDALDQAVERFVDSVMLDDELRPYVERVNKTFLMDHQRRFMSVAFADIGDLDVKTFIIERHYKLFDKGVSEKHFDLILRYMEESLSELSVAPDLIAEMKENLAPFRAVFETTEQSDLQKFLKESVGSRRQSRIEQARARRQREVEELNRRASMNSTLSEDSTVGRRSSMNSVMSDDSMMGRRSSMNSVVEE